MKAVQVLFDESLLAALDADEVVQKEGRSAVLRRMAAEYLSGRRDRKIREQYEKAYQTAPGLGAEWEGWEDEAQWPPE
jgi:metal-responsive CopG/Arc/MetJ family transcriptional regulator